MKTIFIWASPHQITEEQRESLEDLGEVRILKEEIPELFKDICSSPSTEGGIMELASLMLHEIDMRIDMGDSAFIVQPAGSPAFQYALGKLDAPIIYAHSERISEDTTQPDGTIKKISIFKHEGWIGL